MPPQCCTTVIYKPEVLHWCRNPPLEGCFSPHQSVYWLCWIRLLAYKTNTNYFIILVFIFSIMKSEIFFDFSCHSAQLLGEELIYFKSFFYRNKCVIIFINHSNLFTDFIVYSDQWISTFLWTELYFIRPNMSK